MHGKRPESKNSRLTQGEKADNSTVEALIDEIEELQNRSSISFTQDFIAQCMSLETMRGHVELDRTRCTPSEASAATGRRPRTIHVAFQRFMDTMKVGHISYI